MRKNAKWTTCLSTAIVVLATTSTHAASKDIVDTAVSAGSFNTLVAAVQAAGLVDALKSDGPFTVFAPTDEAFSKLPAGTVETLLKPENKENLIAVLTYHVVKGDVPAAKVVKLSGAKTLNGQQVDVKVDDNGVKVDDANVIKTDIACSNGVIHVIDRVILPAGDTIPETAGKAGNFNTLLAAVKAAGLVEAVSGEGPFTLFAPTDDAFAKLPKGTVESLLEPGNKSKLAAILKYHVVPGRVYSSDALNAGEAKTLQGSSIRVSASDGVARVNDATLVATDIDASNGVIHVIDAVILPPSDANAQVRHPRDMIVTAIREGAPLYNAGHAGDCAKIYMSTAKGLLGMNDHGMCDGTVRTLQTSLTKSENSTCAHTQAWTMRHALDFAYRNMPVTR